MSSALHDLYTDSKTFRPDTKVGDVLRAAHLSGDGPQHQASSGPGPAPATAGPPVGESSLEMTAGEVKSVQPDGGKVEAITTKEDSDRPKKGRGSRADRRHSSGESLERVKEVSNEEGLPDGATPDPRSVTIDESGTERECPDKITTERRTSGGKEEGASREDHRPSGHEGIKISVIRPSPVKEARRGSGATREALSDALVKDREADLSCELLAEGEVSNITTTSCTNPKVVAASEGQRMLHFVGVDSQPNSPGEDTPQQPDQSVTSSERFLAKRTSSGVSLDKLRSHGLMANGCSGPHTPSRSRHQSGPQTPLSGSLFDATSQGSVGEEGYDAGSSDSDEEGIMMSFSESMLRYRQLPDFWLIMEIKQDRVDVFFHTRLDISVFTSVQIT